jgi:hypothetical protein
VSDYPSELACTKQTQCRLLERIEHALLFVVRNVALHIGDDRPKALSILASHPTHHYDQLRRELQMCAELSFDICFASSAISVPTNAGCPRRAFTRSALARAPLGPDPVRCDILDGLSFVNLDGRAEPLRDFLGVS